METVLYGTILAVSFLLSGCSPGPTGNFGPEPVVLSISPTSGPAGTVVTLTGMNFITPLEVRFGTVTASSVQVISDSQIIAVAPVQSAVVRDVPVLVITQSGGPSAFPFPTFTYT